VFRYAWLTALMLAEASIILSFIPVQESIFALVLSVLYYSLGGLIHLHLDERLFHHSIREYVIILLVILSLLFFSVAW